MMRFLALLLGLCLAGPAIAQSPARTTVVTLGTGAFGGTYYPVGRAICRVIDRDLRAENVRCSAEPTPGSVYNLRMLQAGELDLAIVQADVQFAALNGRGDWAGAPFRDIRSLFALYDEVFALTAAPESGIAGVVDLRGRLVDTGRAGSGVRATWDALAAALGWQGSDRVRSVDVSDIAGALCNRTIAASVMVGFHPAASLRAQLSACGTRLVPVSGPAVAALLANQPYYRPVAIPAAVYGTPDDIQSFGVSSDLVAGAAADPRIIGLILRAVLANLDDLARQAPALARMQAASLASGLTAPLHPAAAAVYREAGLLR